MDFHLENPGVFKYEEMGLLNFMVFKLADEGRLNVYSRHYQLETNRSTWQLMAKTFNCKAYPPVVKPEDAYVCHFTTAKPMVHYRQYSRAMTDFRRQAFFDSRYRLNLAATIKIWREDFGRRGLRWYAHRFLGHIKPSAVR